MSNSYFYAAKAGSLASTCSLNASFIRILLEHDGDALPEWTAKRLREIATSLAEAEHDAERTAGSIMDKMERGTK